MGMNDELISCIESETKTIYYNFGKNIFKKKKFKFIIKPILTTDILTEDILKETMLEISNGQDLQNATRVAIKKIKDNFSRLNIDSFCKRIFASSIVYPKIVDKENDLKNDEISYSILSQRPDLKLFLFKNLIEISPIFEVK